MPFGRRKKKQTYFYLKGFIKNALSFYRTKKYISLSMKRMRGSPQELSIGLATGLAVSFTPFIGLHALIALFIAWIFGGSMAAAIIGTLFGNPWTFPFFWYLTYEVGQFLNQGLIINYEEFSFNNIREEVTTILEILKNLIIFANMQEMNASFDKLRLIPIMLLGSIPLVIISWITSYFIFLNILKSYKKRLFYK